ncbi:MAG: hypothetical protein RR365_13465 [Bacteroides sp.]
MEVIALDRGEGKTIQLIKRSAQMKEPIVCYKPSLVQQKARELGISIPVPINYVTFVSRCTNDESTPTMLVDDADMFLETLFPGKISAITLSRTNHAQAKPRIYIENIYLNC